jgi:hypothetical protein
MTPPRLLDLFCGAGGATKGYQRAGFVVTGIDIRPQPNYCGDEFIPYDAVEWLRLREAVGSTAAHFDAIHASPPCQHYARVTRWRGTSDGHPDLVPLVRTLLQQTGLPYVMENVYEAPLNASLMLCGSQFGLKVRRHRYFETPWMDACFVPPCDHRDLLPFEHKGERAYADAMGCEWMSSKEGRQAIPPAYTEFIGSQLLAAIQAAAA